MFLKRLSPRTLFSLTPFSSPSPYSISIAECSTFSPAHPTASVKERFSVWWDFENNNISANLDPFTIVQAIKNAAQSSGTTVMRDDIHITAYGDVSELARDHHRALVSSGVTLAHIPHDDEKETADEALLAGLLQWTSKYKPPAHLLIISGDKDFAPYLQDLRMQNYNIILAANEPIHCALRSAATQTWSWNDLIRGKNVTATHFNRPPGFGYLPYEGHLENPFIPTMRSTLKNARKKGKYAQVLFKYSFWCVVQKFINTELGSFLVDESRDRSNLAYNMRKYGPPELKSLSNRHALSMVDIIIIQNKWVIESPNLSKPFKLTPSAGITSS